MIVLPNFVVLNSGRMMLCQALSVLLLVISTLKIVIGQSHGYYLANFLWCVNLTVSGFRKIEFSIAFGQIMVQLLYYQIAGCTS